MKPGRELELLIAVNVMGFKILSHWEPGVIKHVIDEHQCEVDAGHFPKPYSTSIADAWEVVDALWDRDWHLKLERVGVHWECSFMHEIQDVGTEKIEIAIEAPHAICLAALAAVGEK